MVFCDALFSCAMLLGCTYTPNSGSIYAREIMYILDRAIVASGQSQSMAELGRSIWRRLIHRPGAGKALLWARHKPVALVSPLLSCRPIRSGTLGLDRASTVRGHKKAYVRLLGSLSDCIGKASTGWS